MDQKRVNDKRIKRKNDIKDSILSLFIYLLHPKMSCEQKESKSVYTNYKLPRMNLDYHSQFIDVETQDNLIKAIETKVNWSKGFHATRRINQTYGDKGLVYEIEFGGYGNRPKNIVTRTAIEWNQLPELMPIRDKLTELTGEKYNFCVVQRYPTGAGISRHKNKEMVKGTTICGLSLGAECQLVMTPPSFLKHENLNLNLPSGSLYIFSPPTNDYWMHSIVPNPHKECRYSLTFRNVPMKKD